MRFAGRLTLPSRSGPPGSPENGEMWYDTALGKIRSRQGGATVDAITSLAGPSLLHQSWATLIAGQAASTYALNNGSSAGSLGGAGNTPMAIIEDSFLDIPEWTTKIVLEAQVNRNSTAPGSNFTFELVPVTATLGAAGTLAISIGAAVASVAITAAEIAAVPGVGKTVEISRPADAQYIVVVTTSATIATSSIVAMNGKMFVRYARP